MIQLLVEQTKSFVVMVVETAIITVLIRIRKISLEILIIVYEKTGVSLESINPHQKTKTTRDKLIAAGFDFNYFTSIYTTKSGTVYYFVYDQGYLPLENQYYAVVKRE